MSGVGGFPNGFRNLVGSVIRADDFEQLAIRFEDFVNRRLVGVFFACASALTLYIDNRDARKVRQLVECAHHIVQHVRLDDGFNFFHWCVLCVVLGSSPVIVVLLAVFCFAKQQF